MNGADQLRPVELRLVDELFGMSSGYVLDFTNATFADFFRCDVGIDIYDNAYATSGGSKGICCGPFTRWTIACDNPRAAILNAFQS